jgi:hypothetical protein
MPLDIMAGNLPIWDGVAADVVGLWGAELEAAKAQRRRLLY